MVSRTISIEAYDEVEYERRERMTNQVEPNTDDNRKTYHGSIGYNSGDLTDILLEQFERVESGD